MTLHENIQRDIIAAMKAKAEADLSALRLLRAEIKNKEIELRKGQLTDEEIVPIAKRMIKRQKDAIELFKSGGREDLARKAETEIRVWAKYLPAE